MAARFEKIVRPFETREVSSSHRILSAYTTEDRNIIATFGRGGSGKTLSGSLSFTQTYYMDKKYKEVVGPPTA